MPGKKMGALLFSFQESSDLGMSLQPQAMPHLGWKPPGKSRRVGTKHSPVFEWPQARGTPPSGVFREWLRAWGWREGRHTVFTPKEICGAGSFSPGLPREVSRDRATVLCLRTQSAPPPGGRLGSVSTTPGRDGSWTS